MPKLVASYGDLALAFLLGLLLGDLIGMIPVLYTAFMGVVAVLFIQWVRAYNKRYPIE